MQKKKFNKLLHKFSLVLSLFLVAFSNTIPAQAVSDFYSENDIQFYDPSACDPNEDLSDNATEEVTPATDVGGAKGKSLGGVAGTGFTQDEINKVKKFGHGVFEGGSDFYITTYGPPWNSMEGTGITSTGVDLKGPDNSHGKSKYLIAVDPNIIPYGSLVTVWPNALNWRGPFVAADTGGAIDGHHVDVYDWSGDGTKDSASYRNGDVKPYTGSTDVIEAGQTAGGSETTPSKAGCCNTAASSISSIAPGSGTPTGLSFPNLNPDAMAKAINKYIKKKFPSSPYKDLGSTIVASSNKNDLNPFLIVAQAQMETGLGTAGFAAETHSAFNRRATSAQPHWVSEKGALWYKYSSFKASVDSSAPENNDKGNHESDITTYIRKSGHYDRALAANDLSKYLEVYAPTSDGNNNAEYTAVVKGAMEEMASYAGGSSPGGVLPDEPISDDTGASTCTCTDPAADAETETSTPINIPDGAGSEDINKKLKDLAEASGYDSSISVQSIDGSIKGSYSGDKKRTTRSSYKAYTAYAVLRAIEAGKVSWSTRTSFGQSIEKTMEQMIVISNNDAAKALRLGTSIGLYSPSQVTSILRSDVGLSNNTEMGSGSGPTANSRSTSDDFVKFLVQLYNKKLKGVSKSDNYNKLIGFMKRATTDGGSARAGIVAGVGSGVTVADKAGWANGGDGDAAASNDVGIVYGSKPYAIAILTSAPNDFSVVKKISQGVNDEMGNSAGSSSGCSGSVDCQSTSGTAKILCEGKRFIGVYYLYGGGHGISYSKFKKQCPDPSNPPNNKPFGKVAAGKSGNPSPCAVDCSSLVSKAVSAVIGRNYDSAVLNNKMSDPGGGYKWKEINIKDSKAGDIVTKTGGDHVEIVDHVNGSSIHTVGTRSTGTKASTDQKPVSHYQKAYRLTGPGL